jgi:hypothetical protein
MGSALLLMGAPGAAGAPICSQGFFKSDVSGTPGQLNSSFKCATKLILCPPGANVRIVANLTPDPPTTKSGGVVFSYKCNYVSNPP